MSLFKSFLDAYQDIFRLSPMVVDPDAYIPRADISREVIRRRMAANIAASWHRVGDYLRKAMDAAKAEIDPQSR